MSYIFKIVSVLTFLKIVLLIVPINCKNFANLDSASYYGLLFSAQTRSVHCCATTFPHNPATIEAFIPGGTRLFPVHTVRVGCYQPPWHNHFQPPHNYLQICGCQDFVERVGTDDISPAVETDEIGPAVETDDIGPAVDTDDIGPAVDTDDNGSAIPTKMILVQQYQQR